MNDTKRKTSLGIRQDLLLVINQDLAFIFRVGICIFFQHAEKMNATDNVISMAINTFFIGNFSFQFN